MEFRPCSLDQKQAVMTLPSFLSGLEMKSAACDGPNGIRSPHGPGLVPPGDRSLAPRHLPPIRRANCDGLMLTLPALLFHNGLPDLPQSLIEPHRNRAGVWRIKFSYEAGEPLSMDIVQAATMASHLRELGEIELADEVTSAVTRAKRYATM
jgi:hypothetical protein